MGYPGFLGEHAHLVSDELDPLPPPVAGLSLFPLLRFLVLGPDLLGRLLDLGGLAAGLLRGESAFPLAATAPLLLLAGLIGARAHGCLWHLN